ncbi:hypothetical protein DXG01_004151 [Tephrocybe rancida]|nr:hypothetical protein DXG01_004151 [Tephrocybe rancida]
MAERKIETHPHSFEKSSSKTSKKPVLKIHPPSRSASPKRKKSMYRRFKSFLSRFFKLGKYEPPRKRPALRKPVIYVFSPTEIDVSVSVTLDKDMEFTAVYPIVPVKKLQPQGEKIQWDVHTGSNGMLVERETGLELTSLFWEADHKYIALRFMPQAEYSRIAPLDISPKPDVVTRVFMLFQGVRNLDAWPSAQKRARNAVKQWAHIVGVDTAAAFDKDLSRVLEWGAMEIPS